MKLLLNLTQLLGFTLLVTACSVEEEEPTPFFDELEGLSDYEREVVVYFREIALGFEFGNASRVTRKWTTPMRLFIGGEPTQAHIREVETVIREINALATDGFEISIVDDTLQSNAYMFFGGHMEYNRMFPGNPTLLANNWGLFNVSYDESQNLFRARIFIDTYRSDNPIQIHLIREELTQATGLAQDSHRYADSIFQQEFSRVTQYTDLDRDLIRLLYHPKMTSGLNTTSVLEVLREIFAEEGM